MQSTAYRRGGRSVRERGRRGGNAGVQVLANGVHVEAKRRVQLDPSTAPHQHGPVGCHAPALRLAPGRPPSTLPLALAPCRTCTKRPSSRMQSRDEAGRGRGNKGRVAGGRRVAAGASRAHQAPSRQHDRGSRSQASAPREPGAGAGGGDGRRAPSHEACRSSRCVQGSKAATPAHHKARQGKARQGKTAPRRSIQRAQERALVSAQTRAG